MTGAHKTMQARAEPLLRFPQSKTKPPQTPGGFKDLGPSKRATAMAITRTGAPAGLKGHWCRHCRGIWQGFVGECECPVCGNRGG